MVRKREALRTALGLRDDVESQRPWKLRKVKSISRRVPQRTCVACRQVRPIAELIRLVRIFDGSVEVDTGGKRPGRGAYLCQSPACWETGLKGGRLEYALRTTLTSDNREQLIRYGNDLVRESISGRGK